MFELYDVDYIADRLSLRKPQRESLRILDSILAETGLKKGASKDELNAALKVVNERYPTCKDFERGFMSLAFVLATGVGKTRLMGAFITLLYTKYGVKNFFVTVPNDAVYKKTLDNFGNPASSKYVLGGLDCFAAAPPLLVTGDTYRSGQIALFDGSIRIFVYSIKKFDSESKLMHQTNEYLGQSFFEELSQLPDLVVLMDESHMYHGEKGFKALDNLKPLMGLELTATPYYTKKGKQQQFKNAVYEYPLSQSIADGYTRIPYALTRLDIDFHQFGDDQLDRLILSDALAAHENTKAYLKTFAANAGLPVVKPFMLVVCKDTGHADAVYDYLCSDEFAGGAYKDKTAIIHSNQKAAEREANDALIQSVEKADNPIEIIVHVGSLGIGWDVNNLYTIVPLRTATSKILREQMVGRGVRLPYGEQKGVKEVDRVVLTAHDNFNELLRDAQSEASIFNADRVLQGEDLVPAVIYVPELCLDIAVEDDEGTLPPWEPDCEADVSNGLLRVAENLVLQELEQSVKPRSISMAEEQDSEAMARRVTEAVQEKIADDAPVAEVYRQHREVIDRWVEQRCRQVSKAADEKFIPIPVVKVIEDEPSHIRFEDFDLDPTAFVYAPASGDVLIQNLKDQSEAEVLKGQFIVPDTEPGKKILRLLREKPELDYLENKDLMVKLLDQLSKHFEKMFSSDGAKNILAMHAQAIADKIYRQMMDHSRMQQGLCKEVCVGYERRNLRQQLAGMHQVNLSETPSKNSEIRQYIFTGIRKGVFSGAKFDSVPELVFARILERDEAVKNWLRPHPDQFNIRYSGGAKYQPDFVVETADKVYLVEIKGDDRLQNVDVLAKKERSLSFCKVVNAYAATHGEKTWQYLLIPASAVSMSSSFDGLLMKAVY